MHRFAGADPKGKMRLHSHVDPSDRGTPLSVESAFRRVRLLVGALVLARLLTSGSARPAEAVTIAALCWAVNLLASVAERQDERPRRLLGVLQLAADTLVALLFVWLQRGHTGTESADWAVLVLPAIEGAVRFRAPGALATWFVVAGGYAGGNLMASPALPNATVAQRLTVVLLVALPVGYLSEQLLAEIGAHRDGRRLAERRSALLRAAALGGRQASRLDVDGILDVICTTVAEMGFHDPDVFALTRPGDDAPSVQGVAVAGSDRPVAIAPGDDRVAAAIAARASGAPAFWPLGSGTGGMLLALAVPTVDDERVVLTVRCDPAADDDDHDDGDDAAVAAALAPVESLELFVAQAGASLHNARVHHGLELLKDRLDHEASHDALTDLANRRRFTEELDRTAGRGRAGDLLGVLFVDLDGFKAVNDRHGHETGNDLLVAVANRLRDCVRPGDLVARLGGDEFTIMLTRLETVEPAASIAERICSALTEPFTIGSRELRISTSVGVALAPADRADGADLIRRADTAMYRAKSNGKARWSMDAGPAEKTFGIGPEIHASVQGTCNDAPRTSQRRMEEM